MTRLKILSPAKMEAVLLQLGFVKTRQKGSHAFYRHPDGRTTTIPHHGRDLSRPLVREILREIEISLEEFQEVMRKI